MADRDNVIKALEICASGTNSCDKCPMKDRCKGVSNAAMVAAIGLLKEQEPRLLENQHKPYGHSTSANSPWISRCPKCGKKIEGKQTRFCKYCGQAVKWDE